MISGRGLSLLKKYTVFLERGWGLGKGSISKPTFGFSREKKFSPSPRTLHPYHEQCATF
jgi:hypothetical protein